MDPTIFLKFLLFNLAPSILKTNDSSTPIPSILRLKEFDDGLKLRHLLVVIYNALVERHCIGFHENPEDKVFERKIIHFVSSGNQNIWEINDGIWVNEMS
ncbi:hypothetical protein RF11_03393 [Thelohanellus kitauei]|uniref:Uncharacterized protein n=1 Tax=Thelohanellus kitauei TaxID=669202 RepID=A0A0C2J6K3_THEKT|nr:hypothetical protein RF11_03393 [Thelohanellus kitauei]